ncbi:MAG TPA: AAA family ATPase, partial [Parachlamydiaceae bacterium]|nr:AAA family ATPase [Parachlamydiaceae bacterium]
DYLNKTSFPVFKNNYVVISGCSGGGKSAILSELAYRGYSFVPEPGRQIVKEQIAIEGDALPWINLNKFLELALSRYVFQFNQKESLKIVFFDRGIVDAIQLDQAQPVYFQNAAKKFRYQRLVFLVPPWEEIFVNDAERKHDFESAKREFEELLIKYKKFGYETVLIPKTTVKERADFILNRLGISINKAQESTFIFKGKRLLEWNQEKLTSRSDLKIEDLEELFAPDFVVMANGRKHEANYQNYYEFLNKFRSDIETIDYQVQEYINAESGVIMPLQAHVKRVQGNEDVFDAILLIKFNDSGKIIHWQEVYSKR